MDMATYILCKSSAKKYTDQVTQSLMGGVHYRGSVNYYTDLPNNASEGDAYTVKYSGTSGTDVDGGEYVWGYDDDLSDYTWISFSKSCYTKSEADTLLAGKQDILTQTQVAAVNSGINSTDVAQITTNKNDISDIQTTIGNINSVLEEVL